PHMVLVNTLLSYLCYLVMQWPPSSALFPYTTLFRSTVGGDALKVSANLLAPEGRLASVADADVVTYGGRYHFVRPDPQDLTRLTELAEQGALRVHVSETFPLERAADAHRLNQEGRTRGKIVVTVAHEAPEET